VFASTILISPERPITTLLFSIRQFTLNCFNSSISAIPSYLAFNSLDSAANVRCSTTQRGMYEVLTVYLAHQLTVQQLHQQLHLLNHSTSSKVSSVTFCTNTFLIRKLIPNEFQLFQLEIFQFFRIYLQ
jgi:hypothetical protein